MPKEAPERSQKTKSIEVTAGTVRRGSGIKHTNQSKEKKRGVAR